MLEPAVLIATATDVLRGLMAASLLGALTWGAWTFHRAGMARVHRGDSPMARLRPGARALTLEEGRELAAHQRTLALAATVWLSQEHRDARAQLCVYVAQLADDRVPLSQLADAMGVRKQRAHQQAQAGRALAVAPT